MTKHLILQKIREIKGINVSNVYKVFDKKTSNTKEGTGISSENKQSAEEIHKVLWKFEK